MSACKKENSLNWPRLDILIKGIKVIQNKKTTMLEIQSNKSGKHY